jgi:hypothetical protein
MGRVDIGFAVGTGVGKGVGIEVGLGAIVARGVVFVCGAFDPQAIRMIDSTGRSRILRARLGHLLCIMEGMCKC